MSKNDINVAMIESIGTVTLRRDMLLIIIEEMENPTKEKPRLIKALKEIYEQTKSTVAVKQ